MKQLKEGKISTKELADWFGITLGSFRNNCEKKYEILKEYCKYEKYHGGIEVKEVYIAEYSKMASPKNCAYIINKIFDKESKLNSAKGLSKLFQTELYPNFTNNQSYYRVKQIVDLLFGHFNKKSLTSKGLIGERTKVWAVKVDGKVNEYRFLTDEENATFKRLTSESFDLEEADTFLITMLINDNESLVDWKNDFYQRVIQTMKELYEIQIVRVQIYDFIKNLNLTAPEIDYLQTIINEAKRAGWEIPEPM